MNWMSRPTPPLRQLSVAVLSIGAAFVCSSAEAEMTLVRLTPEQYQHSIHDIFGTSIRVDQNKVEPGFRDEGLLALGNRKLTVGSSELERDETLAQAIAAQVVDAKHRPVLVGCKPKAEDAADDGCARNFITRVGLLLFRRPLTSDELQTFVSTQNEAAQRLHSFDAGLAAALARMLVAPDFLFRVENSVPDPAHPGTLQLDAYSRAARLSFFLWNTTPDGELLAAAQSGKLMTPKGLQQQVDRLLTSPRLESGLRAFFTDMLAFSGLDQDPGFDTLAIDAHFYPKFTLNAQNDAREQTLRTIADHLLHRNLDYRDLFTTRDTFLTPALAALYNVPLARSQELGGAVPWVPYHFSDSSPYVGILTHVSFLSLHSHPGRSSPTRRGKALREIFLCQRVPPPPGNVDFSLVQNTNDPRYKTVRQRLTAHRNEPMCAGCHKIMDPLGLSFENFDTAAEYRATENGALIDASGEIGSKSFGGIQQLVQLIRDDPATTSCLITRVYSYGTERKPSSQEQTWLTNLQSELSKDGVRWRELMRRITLNPDFYAIPLSAAPLSAAAAHDRP
jgi:Protein of unknown function (DUF1592)/Protein of unknown function (DUF1588)/Protein of unknown function (DUF1595)/Protein of unknown function (DUF1585)